jgi:hypothetical protein
VLVVEKKSRVENVKYIVDQFFLSSVDSIEATKKKINFSLKKNHFKEYYTCLLQLLKII